MRTTRSEEIGSPVWHEIDRASGRTLLRFISRVTVRRNSLMSTTAEFYLDPPSSSLFVRIVSFPRPRPRLDRRGGPQFA